MSDFETDAVVDAAPIDADDAPMCDVCGDVFDNQMQMAFHIVDVHTEIKNEEEMVEESTTDSASQPEDATKATPCPTESASTNLNAYRGPIVIHAAPTRRPPQLRQHKCPDCHFVGTRPGVVRTHFTRCHDPNAERAPLVFDAAPKPPPTDPTYDETYYSTRPHRCAECRRSYPSRKGLVFHERRAHGRRTTPSTVRRVYDDAYYATRPHRCAKCKVAYVYRYMLRTHGISAHSMDVGEFKTSSDYYAARPHKCGHCTRAFTKWGRLRRHCKETHGENIGVCDERKYKSTMPRSYYARRPYKCDQCNRAYATKQALSTHKLRKHDVARVPIETQRPAEYYETRPFPCDKCRRAYSMKRLLNAHRVRVHNVRTRAPIAYDATYYDERAFRCVVCPSAFSLQCDLARHGRRVHDRTPIVRRKPVIDADYYATRPFRCDVCPNAFDLRSNLSRHGKRVHNLALLGRPIVRYDDEYYAARPFRCDRCPLAYEREERLAVHVRRTHDQRPTTKVYDEVYYAARPFRCELCPTAFAARFRLSRHRHTTHKLPLLGAPTPTFDEEYYGTRPHRCDQCPKAYPTVAALKRHCEQGHNLVEGGSEAATPSINHPQPFKCVECDKGYKTKASLRMHKSRVHAVLRSLIVNNAALLPEVVNDAIECPEVANGAVPSSPVVTDAVLRPEVVNDAALRPSVISAVARRTYDMHSCDRCDKVYKSRVTLVEHIRQKHRDPCSVKYSDAYYAARKYRCDLCRAAYQKKTGLQAHRSASHRSEIRVVDVTPSNTHDAPPTVVEMSPSFTADRSTVDDCPVAAELPPSITADRSTDGRFACAQCPSTFTRSANRRIHVRRTHTVEPRPHKTENADFYRNREHRCDLCPLAFKGIYSLRKHRNAKHGRSTVTAAVDNSASLRATASRRTVKDRDAPPTYDADYYAARKDRCERCPMAFTHGTSLARHRKRSHSSGFKCRAYYDGCDEETATHAQMMKHHNAIHADAFEYNAVYYAARAHTCEHCPMACFNEFLLNEHLLLVHNDGPRPSVKVEEVPKIETKVKETPAKPKSSTKSTKKTQSIKIAESVVFSCSFCPANAGQTFASKWILNQHFKQVHNDARRSAKEIKASLACPSCGKAYKSMGHLNNHVANCDKGEK